MEKPLKRSSIFFIFFISILGVTFHHHEDGMPHDDCLICKIVTNNRIFLTQDSLLSNQKAGREVTIILRGQQPCKHDFHLILRR